MCTHYTATRNDAWVRKTLGVGLPPPGSYDQEVFPGYKGPLARSVNGGEVTVEPARFGLVPHWAKDENIGRRTYNARSETVGDKPSYRTAWRQRQVGICLLDSFYEPNWETGRAVKWRIQRSDGDLMGVACLWDTWAAPTTGDVVTSFTMLTVNADGHPVMGRFHRPGDEKRSVVVLPVDAWGAWLIGGEELDGFLQRPSITELVAEPATSEAVPELDQRSLF